MKSRKILVLAIGLCIMEPGFAKEVFSLVNTGTARSESYISSMGFNSLGTDNLSPDFNGRQIVSWGFQANTNPRDPTPGRNYRNVYLETIVSNLKPNGSNIVHGLAGDGYIEEIWRTGNGVLFTTEILPNKSNYLYRTQFNQSLGLITVGNNAPDFNNKQAVMNLGDRGKAQALVRPMHSRSLLADFSLRDANGNPVWYYGDYYNSSGKVALWKSLNEGNSWTKVIEWSTAGHPTLHINGVVKGANNSIYILFGDDPTESGIVLWDGVSPAPANNTPLTTIASGNIKGWKAITGADARTGDLLFIGKQCVWIPEINPVNGGKPLYGQRANLDLSGWERTGQVPYTEGQPPVIGASGKSWSGGLDYHVYDYLYWASYKDQSAAENKVSVWKSVDFGLSWELAGKLNVYTNETAVPINFVGDESNAYQGSAMRITGRALEFVSGGAKLGSQAIFASNTVEVLPVTRPDTEQYIQGVSEPMKVVYNDSGVPGTDIVIVTPPAHGQAGAAPLSGSVYYTPDPGYIGQDNFSYALKNSVGTSNTSVVTINVIDPNTPVPSSSVAIADTGTTPKGQPVTLNLTSNDTNVGTNKVNIVNYPSSGNVAYADSSQTSVIYTPNTGFVGSDTFTYNLKSATGTSNTATVTVTVTDTTPPPPPPSGSAVAMADTGSTAVGTPITLSLTSNDTNVGTSIVNIVGYPGHGNVAYSDSTSKSITYTPNATFTGTDTFTYNLKSSAGTSNTVTVTITVGGTTPPPPPPPTGTGAVANGDTMTIIKGTPVTLNLTSNDTNVGTSTVNIAGYPNNGNVAYSDSTKKSITYTPDATFVGADSFTYNLKSASGTSNTATVSVKVQ